jgi:hypothetical protein
MLGMKSHQASPRPPCRPYQSEAVRRRHRRREAALAGLRTLMRGSTVPSIGPATSTQRRLPAAYV